MKLVIDGYNKSIHKKDNQIVIHEKEEIIDSIKANNITDITIVGKGSITFDALNLIALNNIIFKNQRNHKNFSSHFL